jgi:gamma-glutamylcyclotransferase (GGCT)/AIG2-like uncharacterized protein YtfP
MNQYMFSYGANTNIPSMRERCPSAKWCGTATLPGYALRFRIHADIELDPDAAVHGVLWYIDDEVLQALDYYEGYPYYYTRITVEVWQDGEPMQALVYVMNDQSWEDLPSKDYLMRCQAGYISSNVPVDQIDEALAHLRESPQWDPVFNRMKKTAAREFGESILKAEYYDED